MVSKLPPQQAASQSPLVSAELWANAFSLWPFRLHLIIQNSVNLDLIAVCHERAHQARVGGLVERLVTAHAAAGTPPFQVGDKVVAGEQLTWSETRVCVLFVIVRSVDVTLEVKGETGRSVGLVNHSRRSFQAPENRLVESDITLWR